MINNYFQMFEKKEKEVKERLKTGIKISSKEKINFLEQLSNLLQSGIPVLNSIKIIMYQTKNKKVKTLLNQLIIKLNKGDSLSNAFSNFPKTFNIFDISIIEMGEVTGGLGEAIETVKIKEEKSKELKSKIIGALIYPIVVMVLSTVMIGIFMVYVIPKIQTMYSDAKVNLPVLTQTVINISEFIQHNIVWIILGIVSFIGLIIIFKTWKVTKIYWDNMILRIPLFGGLIKKKILALFASSLGMLLESGIIITKAIDITSKALDNNYYEKKLNEMNSRVAKGIELSNLMGVNEIQSGKENFLFPIELASTIKIGEETGNIGGLLLKISNKMNKEIDSTIKNIQTAIEPIVIIGVGLIVGVLIMAIMMPFFNMVNVI